MFLLLLVTDNELKDDYQPSITKKTSQARETPNHNLPIPLTISLPQPGSTLPPLNMFSVEHNSYFSENKSYYHTTVFRVKMYYSSVLITVTMLGVVFSSNHMKWAVVSGVAYFKHTICVLDIYYSCL